MANYVSKSDLVKGVSDAAGITRSEAEKAINAFFDQAAAHLNDSVEVRVAGFGAFSPTYKSPRKVTLNGQESTTRGHSSVLFKPYDVLKTYE